MLRTVLIIAWIVLAAACVGAGWEYYLTPIQQRPFSDSHAFFASSAFVGHGYGVVGSAFMVIGVLLYSVRKRASALGRLGKLKHWLQFHIFLCTFGPFLVLLHSTFRVGGLVAIAFWSMALVVASGVFGRYVYVRIPKSVHGSFLSLKAIEERKNETLSSLRAGGALDGPALERLSRLMEPGRPRGLLEALALGIRHDFTRRRREREIRELVAGGKGTAGLQEEAVVLAMEDSKLAGQAALFEPFLRLFRYWHVFHLPLAIVMFLILAVHVTVAVLFGYAWVL